MTDVLQKAAQTLATENGATRDMAIGLAVYLLYLLCAAWLVTIGLSTARISVADALRVGLLLLLAFLAAQVLHAVVSDPRPYITAHTQPLTPVGHDNGFPSDHTLLAAALTASLWWIDRRALWAFTVGTLLIAIGRLGIGAHHTLDVAGSMGIVAVVAVGVAQLRLPAVWDRTLVPPRQGSSIITNR
jgi:undecaprenyl-diphosphatase